MANAFQTATLITNEVLRIAHNASAFLGNMNTDYEANWKGKYAPGSTVYARRPVQFTIRDGAAVNLQDLTDSTVPITVNPEMGIDFAVQEFDLVTAIRNDGGIDKAFRERFLKPAGLRSSSASICASLACWMASWSASPICCIFAINSAGFTCLSASG